MTLTEFLGHLEGVSGGGGQYSARCPAHGDRHNSLSVSVGQDGRILLHCHAGCTPEDIVWSMGLAMKDLFAEITPGQAFPAYSAPAKPGAATFEAEYIYPGGTLKKVKLRHPDGGKHFYWMRLEGGQWVKGRGQVTPPLYASGPLPGAVFLVEGEKDVDTLKSLGKAAVSPPDGAKSKWRPEYGDALAERTVVIIQDNDAPGKEFAQKVAGELMSKAAGVKVLDLRKIWPEIPEHGDVTDLIVQFGPQKGLLMVLQLAKDTPEWGPEMDSFLSCFRTLDDFQEEEAKWLIPGWIPESQVTLMAADGGVGKTTIWCDIIAALSNGTSCILDPPGHTRTPMKVAFFTTEDSVKKKLRRKLRLMGANMENIMTPDFTGSNDLLHKLKFGSPEMERVLRHFHPVFCTFDPVQGFVPPRVNMGSRNEMRDCMAPLITIGEEVGTTSLVVCHTNKRKGASGRDRIADSADLWDIARSVLMAGYTEAQGVRYLSNEKNNYAQLQETVLFTIDNDGRAQRVGTSWKRDKEYTLEADISKSAPKREDCKAFILKTITDAGGSLPTKEMEDAVHSAGYAFKTIRNAKDDLRKEGAVKYYQIGGPKEKVWYIQRLTESEFVEVERGADDPWNNEGSV